jgi:glycosyltransferase involved in cell wall biosynthesis
MKPKLLYIAPQNPYPPIDGGKISIYYSVIYLSSLFDIIFVCPIEPSQYRVKKKETEEHFSRKNINVILFPYNTKQDIKYLAKNFFKKEPFKWDKYYSKKLQKEINSLIKEENVNFIWVIAPHMARYALEAKKKFPKLKIFLREHNIEFKLVEQFKDFTNNPIYKIIAQWQFHKSKKLEVEYWKLFDKIFFISDLDYSIAKDLAPEIENNFVVLYDGYEIITDKPVNSKKRDFIYTANLKTIQNLISFKWFVQNIWLPNLNNLKEMNIKLYITGNNDLEIKNALGFTNLNDYNIINLGFVNDINQTILDYKYVLSPTLIGSGLRLKVLNGTACGKPVFLTPLDLSTCKVFKDMENVVCFNSAIDFIEKLNILENDNDLYLKISKKAIETIKTYFNWNKYAEKVYKIIISEV